jgi:GTPase SAR1 family protein
MFLFGLLQQPLLHCRSRREPCPAIRWADFMEATSMHPIIYQYIGLCYGPPGVGKTLSARRYSHWDFLEKIDRYAVPNEALESLIGIRTIFYTTPVVNTPGRISSEIDLLRSRLHSLAIEPLRREAAQKLNQIDIGMTGIQKKYS